MRRPNRTHRQLRVPLLAALVLALLPVLGVAVLPESAAAAPSSGAGFANVLGLATTDSGTLQARVEAELRARPGGRQVSQYEIAYAGGSVVLALPAPGRRAAAPASTAALHDGRTLNVRAGTAMDDAGASAALAAPAAYGRGAGSTVAGRAAAAAPAAGPQVFGDSGSCPYSLTTKWYCWYTDAGFDGARFQFSSDYCPGLAQSVINFADWGRDNTATSWVNNRFSTIQVYDGPSGSGTLLWTEPRVSNSANVGASLNDRATSARTC